MMSRFAVRVGDRDFRTKQELLEFVREMLGRYAVSGIVLAEDDKFLRALLQRHPEASAKSHGLAHFRVGNATDKRSNFGTKCFIIVRDDGSEDDFSYMKCIYKKRPGPES